MPPTPRLLGREEVRGSAGGRAAHFLGTCLIVGGVLLVAWAIAIWAFGDPVTGAWYRFEQQRLEARYARRERSQATLIELPRRPSVQVDRPSTQVDWPSLQVRLAAAAGSYGRSLSDGDPVGEIVVRRLGLRTMVVKGTSTSALRRGPGLDNRTSLPGRGDLVYIAGHRTTYGAPFAAIDTMKPGDTVVFRLPYATFRYVVTGHRIVDANDLSVLGGTSRETLVLQACHPRFLARERYLVDARLVEVVVSVGGSSRAVRPS